MWGVRLRWGGVWCGECRLECGVESCVGRVWCGECRQAWGV